MSSTTGSIRVGQRVIASTKDGIVRGVVAYVGETDFALGSWIGLRLNDPGTSMTMGLSS